MEALIKVKLKSLEPYRHLFPGAGITDTLIKKGSTVEDTVDFIPKMVAETSWQVQRFVEQELKGLSTYDACKKLWNWVKYHIEYRKDKRGEEQVKSSRRLVHDGYGDCDDFTGFIRSCLRELGIPAFNRITKYWKDYFQHIYPVVPLENGEQIIMDCVVNRFNYEEPYSEKKDYKMDLHYLDGIETETQVKGNVDAQAIYGHDDEDLGKLKFNLFKNKKSAMPGGEQPKKKGFFNKVKEGIKKVLNVVNKLNPATALLRAGVLAAMKTNMFKVAQKIKWAYLNPADAQKKGADMSKFGKLKNVLTRLEQIFYSAGGNPENLKKSILQGRGNKNREVAGLGLIDPYDIDYSHYDENTPMPQLLGEIYEDEFAGGTEGTEGLGAVITTGAAIAAATSAMTLIAGLVKSVGNLFPGKKTEDFSEGQAATATPEPPPPPVTESYNETASPVTEESPPGIDDTVMDDAPETNASPPKLVVPTQKAVNVTATRADTTNMALDKTVEETPPATEEKGIKAFWTKNKKWLKPVSITTAIAGALYLGYRFISKNKEGRKQGKGGAALSGIGKAKKKKKKSKKKSSGGKKSNIALM